MTGVVANEESRADEDRRRIDRTPFQAAVAVRKARPYRGRAPTATGRARRPLTAECPRKSLHVWKVEPAGFGPQTRSAADLDNSEATERAGRGAQTPFSPELSCE